MFIFSLNVVFTTDFTGGNLRQRCTYKTSKDKTSKDKMSKDKMSKDKTSNYKTPTTTKRRHYKTSNHKSSILQKMHHKL
jgi:hypothetical protein